VIALKEVEHRPLIERRFPGVASRVTYWQILLQKSAAGDGRSAISLESAQF
jgi:hypothetical protein